ncbi:Secretion protein HlyD [sediment metagenome]|uniref:Secretion protein HlyD n=1 Tax=sediment metagenome TaxID=749907 RepID=D9PMZ5_9ZZZZ
MSVLFSRRWLYIGLALAIIGSVLLMIAKVSFHETTEQVTATVDRGTVRQLVSVSGVAEALQSAKLAFPTSGTVSKVLVKKGDVVAAGDSLVVLDLSTLLADRKDAAAALAKAVADRDALVSGPTATSRDVTSETVIAKELALTTTKETEARKISNAYRTLLSDDLAARSEDPSEDATPPTVSGTYHCDQEGSYTITVYSSAADSGYSYTLSGLESGTYTASTDQPTPLGTCGLYLLFDAGSEYRRSSWTIDVPNTAATSYTSNKNAYELAKDNATAAIKTAEQALALARADATNQNAPARSEDIRKVDAAIAQARARLERIDASLSDLSLTAPFDGTITELDILPGETVTTAPIVTLLTDSAFEVVARIPEIDIGKIAVGQKTELLLMLKMMRY